MGTLGGYYMQDIYAADSPPDGVLLAKRAPYVGALFVDHRPLLRGGSGGANLSDEVAQACGRGHSDCGRRKC